MKPYYEDYFKEVELKQNKIKSLEEELKILREKSNNKASEYGPKQIS